MKLTVILIITTLMEVSAASFAQKVSYINKHASLEQIFKEIRKQTGYNILISADVLADKPEQEVNFNQTPLNQVLDQTLQGLSLTYQMDNKTVLIKEKQVSLLDKVKNFIVAPFTFRGKVLDENNLPLPGATVIVKGANIIAITNEKGEFAIAVDNVGSTTFQVSYVGYTTAEITSAPKTETIIVYLVKSQSKLDEVQIIAYGSTTQRLNTGSQSSLSAKDIDKQPVNNIIDALIGRIPGLQITPTSGIQGAAPAVLIRGKSSMNASTTPLYILDGVPITATQQLSNAGGLDNNALNLLLGINPSDVESVSVLKDADATAIYGSRGANGVILITTKKGKVGKMTTALKASTGIQKVANFIKMLDVDQYISMRTEAFKNDGITPVGTSGTNAYAPDLFLWGKSDNHDWQREFLGGTAVSNDLGLSFSGGTDKTRYFISSAYHKEGTIMPGESKLERKSFLASVSSESDNKKFNILASASYSETTLNLLPQNLVSSIFLAPNYPLYNADGTPNWSITSFPLASTLRKYFAPTKNFNGNASVDYEVFQGLKVKATGGVTLGLVRMSQEIPKSSLDPATGGSASLINQNVDNYNWIVEPQIEYNRNVDKHHLSVLAGSTFQKTTQENMLLNGTGFIHDALIADFGAAATKTITHTKTPYTYSAFFGRINYNYNQEFLANLTYRRDGSSRFGDDRKFGNFGAIGLGWIFTQQNWVKENLPLLSYGKIRGSYGVTGNDGIGDFQYLSTYYAVANGPNGGSALTPSGISNPDLQWERNQKREFALELGFLKDRILLTTSFFRNRTDQQLISQTISTQGGFFTVPINFPGVVVNNGIEIELSAHNLQGDFTWNTNFNFSVLDSKLTEYPDFAGSPYTFRYALGESLTVIKGTQYNGLNAAGVPTYLYANGTTGTASPANGLNGADRAILGDADPMYGGISNEFSYKGFSFSFFVNFTRMVGTPGYVPRNRVGFLNSNQSTYVLNAWHNPGDELTTNIPKYTTISTTYDINALLNTAEYIAHKRYIFRLNNATFGYDLPKTFISKLNIKRFQVFANAQNLYAFDKYKDYELDPQIGNAGMPLLRTIVFGINASF